MHMIFLHVIMQLVTITWSLVDVAESRQFDVRETITELIHDLCPLVDICDVNATTAEVRPNELIHIERGLVSCCQGCSCHPDCTEMDNCCYPDDYKSNSEVQPATKLTECLYTRLGQPEMIDGLVPAFKTIVGEPREGCVDTRPIRISPKVVLHPTCDDIDVTPLGPYYPVFSRDTGAIYENVLCALCHGIFNTETFLPNLVCKNSYLEGSMTDFLHFLETGFLSLECYVDFNFTDVAALKDNRCYKDPIDSCLNQNTSFPNGFNPPDLNFDTIQSLCESGFNSPTVNVQNGLVYKNAFCSLCGNTKPNPVYLTCSAFGQRKTFDESLTFILNTKMMHTINMARDPKTKNEACLVYERSEQQKICKQIYCPTGKIRNEDGDCELIGNYLGNTKGVVYVKLTPAEQITLGNESQKTFNEHLVQGLKENNPWPVKWEVDKIYKNMNITECDESAIATIILRWHNRNTRTLYDEIEHSIRLTWQFEWKGKRYLLMQSLMEYNLVWSREIPLDLVKPSWQKIQTSNLPVNIFVCGSMRWETVFWNLKEETNNLVVNKLFFCDQIQLQWGEFILGPDSLYLESNLTKRILYDLEFDIVEDKDGRSARVCSNDVILADKSTNEGTTLKTESIHVLLSMIEITLLAEM